MGQRKPSHQEIWGQLGFFNELDLYPMGETCLAPSPCPCSLPHDNILTILMSPLPLFLGVICASGLLEKLHGTTPPGKLLDISHQVHGL